MDTNKKETYFIDIDGTILKYRKFNNYYNKEAKVIPSTLKFIEEKFNEGHMIVLTTARPESMLPHTVKELLTIVFIGYFGSRGAEKIMGNNKHR